LRLRQSMTSGSIDQSHRNRDLYPAGVILRRGPPLRSRGRLGFDDRPGRPRDFALEVLRNLFGAPLLFVGGEIAPQALVACDFPEWRQHSATEPSSNMTSAASPHWRCLLSASKAALPRVVPSVVIFSSLLVAPVAVPAPAMC